jgi:hypothetical protein
VSFSGFLVEQKIEISTGPLGSENEPFFLFLGGFEVFCRASEL